MLAVSVAAALLAAAPPDAGVVLLRDGGVDPDQQPVDDCTIVPPQPALEVLSRHEFRRYGHNNAFETGRFPDGTVLERDAGGCYDGIGDALTFKSPKFALADRAAAVRALLPWLARHRRELSKTLLRGDRVMTALREWADGHLAYDPYEGLCLGRIEQIGCTLAIQVELAPGGITVSVGETL